MFCYKCGCNNSDENRYCTDCGTELKVMRQVSAVQNPVPPTPAPAQDPYAGQPINNQQGNANYYGQQPDNRYHAPQQDTGYYGQPPVMQNPYNPYAGSSNPAKNMFSSVLFMVGIIGYSASLLITLITTISGHNSIAYKLMSAIDKIVSLGIIDFNELGISPYDFYSVIGHLSGPSGLRIVSTLISSIPSILVTLGFWLIFVSARNKTSPVMTTGGFTILKVLSTIQMVLAVLACVILEIALFAIGLSISSYTRGYYKTSPMTYFVFGMIVILAIFVVEFLYLTKLIKTIGSLRDAGATGNPTAFVSTFVAVVFFISFAGSIINLIGSLLNPIGALPILGTAVYQFCMGLFLFKIKGQLTTAE